jgi:hypothetical protein
MLPVATLITAWHSLLAAWVRVRFGKKVAATAIKEPPVFVLGHWRTGTTLLHELLALDGRFAAPNFFQCFYPSTFLLTEKLVRRLTASAPLNRRPQDNMTFSVASPNEDEFALMRLGVGSPYTLLSFPNETRMDAGHLDLLELPEQERERWKRTLLGFLRAVALRDSRRLVLKSPTHTARVRTLLELFPDAKFVNIVRDPRVVYCSTLHTIRSLTGEFGLQRPTYAGLEGWVTGNYLRMHARLTEARPLIPAGNFAEVRYEELVRDPVGQMRRLYETLGLGGFDAVRPAVEGYFAQRRDYRTNRYNMSPEQRARVEAALERVIRETGYSQETPP